MGTIGAKILYELFICDIWDCSKILTVGWAVTWQPCSQGFKMCCCYRCDFYDASIFCFMGHGNAFIEIHRLCFYPYKDSCFHFCFSVLLNWSRHFFFIIHLLPFRQERMQVPHKKGELCCHWSTWWWFIEPPLYLCKNLCNYCNANKHCLTLWLLWT